MWKLFRRFVGGRRAGVLPGKLTSSRLGIRQDQDGDRASALAGKAYVIDGDTIRVSGKVIRIAGIDAPESDQVAKNGDGRWFGHGKRVKSSLIKEIGGKIVHVDVEKYDKFGRAVGSVTCNGRNVGEWLVAEGHARALYCDRFKHIERQARMAGRGIWGHESNIDPRVWRRRQSNGN